MSSVAIDAELGGLPICQFCGSPLGPFRVANAKYHKRRASDDCCMPKPRLERRLTTPARVLTHSVPARRRLFVAGVDTEPELIETRPHTIGRTVALKDGEHSPSLQRRFSAPEDPLDRHGRRGLTALRVATASDAVGLTHADDTDGNQEPLFDAAAAHASLRHSTGCARFADVAGLGSPVLDDTDRAFPLGSGHRGERGHGAADRAAWVPDWIATRLL